MAKKPSKAGNSRRSARDFFAAPNPSNQTGGAKDDKPEPIDKDGNLSVLIEMRVPAGGASAFAMSMASSTDLPGVTFDHEFAPVPMNQGASGFGDGGETVIMRVKVASTEQLEQLRTLPNIVNIWPDTPIAGFADAMSPHLDQDEMPSMAPCPIGTCDCAPSTPKGTIADVATYLGVDQIWAAGKRGAGIVVGVLDSGITAVGRPVKAGETSRRIARVIDGWPSDWGTESSKWSDHGNMCATDVLGMAPECQLYDLRIAGSGGSPGTISRALQAFQWAIDRYRVDGTPQVLTNSWGIFQESWDATYARNPAHPFTRKVGEAMDLGILVLFAAGNCGDTCPDGRCGPDIGPGRSIWGANGLTRVMTVGAVNRHEQFIGYSSRGPAALDPDKPDFCGVSHFTGYNHSDSGTSAATPIVAGVVALLRQQKPALRQDECRTVLRNTAKDIGATGFDRHSGAGIIRAKHAFDHFARIYTRPIGDIAKHPRSDPVGTWARNDTMPLRDIIKHPIHDLPESTPRIDVLKSPARDVRQTLAEHIGNSVPREQIRRFGTRGQLPFALATPHRAPSWRDYEETDELEQLQEYIAALSESIEAQQDELQSLVEAYEEMAQGEGDWN